MFQFVLGIAEAEKLMVGKTVGVDSTTLQANAAMKSIVRRDTGDDWKEYVTRLMREEGVIGPEEKPTVEEIVCYNHKRKDKTVSNDEWKSAIDEDARIARMKDGTTHRAYKAEHVVDLDSDLALAADVSSAVAADATNLPDSLVTARLNRQAAASPAVMEEVAADKGCHAAATIDMCDLLDVRTYIPEPQTARTATWPDKPKKQPRGARNNRRRMARPRGKALQRRRSEVVERTIARLCETGGSRRSPARGLGDVAKRHPIAVAARNRGRILRRLPGQSEPKAGRRVGGLGALVRKIEWNLSAAWGGLGRWFRELRPRPFFR